jgi:uncharacterized protein (DUF1330 family)
MSIYITQLIYLKPNAQAVFDEFESLAIPIIKNYRGLLLFRLRPDENEFIEKTIEAPYEIHLIEFESEEWFRQFMADKTRLQFLHLKEQSIRESWLIQGKKL